jgi:hypothetical protein
MELAGTSGIKRGNELATNSTNKNIRDLYRGINEFKKGYQPRTNLVKDEKEHFEQVEELLLSVIECT